MWSLFLWGRLPVVLIIFAAALRKKSVKNILHLLPVLLGLLLTSPGDWAMSHGNMLGGCVFFGMAHLCWFAYLVRRGVFSWHLAGVLTFLLLPFLAALVFPRVGDDLEIAFSLYTFCSIISVSAAWGARKAPCGIWYLAGTAALLVSDVFIALRLTGAVWAKWAVGPIYLASLILLATALIRNISAAGTKSDDNINIAPQDQMHRNAVIQLWAGCLMPLFFLAAMIFYNGNYCWYTQYISSSGVVFLKNRAPNHLSAWLLSSGLTGSALLCWWYFADRFRWGKGFFWQRGMMLLFGTIGCIGLAGIGATPYDQHPELHELFTLCSVPFGLALACTVTADDLFGRRSEKVIWLIFVLFTGAAALCFSYLRKVAPYGLPPTPTGQVIQKMVVLAFYVYMLGQVITYVYNSRKKCREISR